MINTDMRFYDYYKLGEKDEYGQPQLPSLTSEPTGQILMCINLSSQAITDNIKYSNCSYIGLTRENVNDTYIIKYENELLKVLYVNPKGRLKQVYLADMA
jgi:hypothetical protein